MIRESAPPFFKQWVPRRTEISSDERRQTVRILNLGYAVADAPERCGR
jgi:hypothetical protein